VDDQIRKI